MAMKINQRISRVVLLIATALLAGLCGALAVFIFLNPEPVIINTVPERVLAPVQSGVGKGLPRIPVVSVALISQKSLKPVPGGRTVADADLLGRATVMTSDGWLVADRFVFESIADPAVVMSNGTVFPPTAIVTDAATNLTFFKVDARDLDVVAFGESTGLKPGTPLFALEPNRGVLAAPLTLAAARPRGEARDAVRPSNAPAERLLLSNSLSKNNAGSGVVTDSGALVGIVSLPKKTDVATRFAIPIEAVSRTLRDIARTGGIHYPTIGVSTVDLSEVVARSSEFTGSFGAIVAAVDQGGPATELKVGDRITGINAEALDGTRLLADVLAGYRIGEKIIVTFTRGSEQKTVAVTVADSAAKSKPVSQ